MTRTRIASLASCLALAALVVGCAGNKPAADAQAAASAEPVSVAAPAASTAGASGAAATTATAVAAPVVTDPLVALNDPNSPISNRVVYFEFDRSEIQQQHLSQLEAHARFLVLNPQLKVRLEGHCDERGTREYNIGLGDRRAQAVRRVLMFQGVAAGQIVTVSYGEEKPAADGHDESAWAKNRFVEIVYQR